MPQQQFNFLEDFIRGRSVAENLKGAQQEREFRKKQESDLLKQLREESTFKQIQTKLAEENVKHLIRQQLMSGEVQMPSQNVGSPPMLNPTEALLGTQEQPQVESQQMISPQAMNFDIGGGRNFRVNPSDIINARQQMIENLLSQGRAGAQVKGMEASAEAEGRLPSVLSLENLKTQGDITQETIRQIGLANRTVEQQRGAQKVAEIRASGTEKAAQVAATSREKISKFHEQQANYRAQNFTKNNAAESSARIIATGHDNNALTKKAVTASEALSFIKKLDPKTTNPGDDIGLIYAFAKAMDPESTVREGEYATIQKYAQSWKDKFGFSATRILANTEFLTPESRNNLKKTIQERATSTLDIYKNYRKNVINRINTTSGGKISGEKFLGISPDDFVGQTDVKTESKKENIVEIGGRKFRVLGIQ